MTAQSAIANLQALKKQAATIGYQHMQEVSYGTEISKSLLQSFINLQQAIAQAIDNVQKCNDKITLGKSKKALAA